jgi:hypothetical protein
MIVNRVSGLPPRRFIDQSQQNGRPDDMSGRPIKALSENFRRKRGTVFTMR